MGRHARTHTCICQSSLRTPQPHSVQQSRHSCCCSTAFLNEFYMFSALPLCFLCTPSGDGRRKVGSMQIPVNVKVFAFTLHTPTHICTHSVGMCTVYINTRLVDFWLLLCLLLSFSLSQLVVYAEDGRDSEVGWAWSWSCSVCLLLHLAAGEANVITMKLTFICIAKLLFTFALPTLRRGNKYICINYAINLRFQLQISLKITI